MKQTIIKGISYFFVVLFLYTGISKLMDHAIFTEQIAVSPVLKPIALWIAWLLPAAELVTAALLFLPLWRLKGLYTTLGIMSLFTGYIILIMIFDKELPCSCGGVLELLSWTGHLLFNGVCIVLAGIGMRLQKRLTKKINFTI